MQGPAAEAERESKALPDGRRCVYATARARVLYTYVYIYTFVLSVDLPLQCVKCNNLHSFGLTVGNVGGDAAAVAVAAIAIADVAVDAVAAAAVARPVPLNIRKRMRT